ncbi:hypothetical protein GQ42DRAFT_89431 [Ramicandelaber brevisporus]|nr:hypothetical protein GQ42DRAFT_89431 [Ramicandelaber brevisporus]
MDNTQATTSATAATATAPPAPAEAAPASALAAQSSVYYAVPIPVPASDAHAFPEPRYHDRKPPLFTEQPQLDPVELQAELRRVRRSYMLWIIPLGIILLVLGGLTIAAGVIYSQRSDDGSWLYPGYTWTYSCGAGGLGILFLFELLLIIRMQRALRQLKYPSLYPARPPLDYPGAVPPGPARAPPAYLSA